MTYITTLLLSPTVVTLILILNTICGEKTPILSIFVMRLMIPRDNKMTGCTCPSSISNGWNHQLNSTKTYCVLFVSYLRDYDDENVALKFRLSCTFSTCIHQNTKANGQSTYGPNVYASNKVKVRYLPDNFVVVSLSPFMLLPAAASSTSSSLSK